MSDSFFNSDASYIAIGKSAGAMIARLLGDDQMPFEELRKCIIGAANDGQINMVDSTKELHFLAKATLRGRECYLICVASDGSPAGKQLVTCKIKGVMLPDDAMRLIQADRGLAPIGDYISKARHEL